MLVSKLSMTVEFCRRVLISDRVFFKIYLQGLLKLNFAEELCSLDVFRKQVMFDGGLFEAKRARVGCLHIHYSLETFSA